MRLEVVRSFLAGSGSIMSKSASMLKSIISSMPMMVLFLAVFNSLMRFSSN